MNFAERRPALREPETRGVLDGKTAQTYDLPPLWGPRLPRQGLPLRCLRRVQGGPREGCLNIPDIARRGVGCSHNTLALRANVVGTNIPDIARRGVWCYHAMTAGTDVVRTRIPIAARIAVGQSFTDAAEAYVTTCADVTVVARRGVHFKNAQALITVVIRASV